MSAARMKRMSWVVAAAAVLTLAGGTVGHARATVDAGPVRLVSGGLAPPIGDPRTADPCGLLNVGAVQRFGPARMIRDIGYPQECGIVIGTGGEGYLTLAATFGAAENRAPAGVAERFGDVTISREAAGARSCRRTVVLGDRSRVYVTAEAYHGAAGDPCAVADVGTRTAVSALSSGSLPRRDVTDPPNALTWLDTCSLLDQAALRRVPGLDAPRRNAGFAGWLCVWGDNPAVSGEPQVRVSVQRRFRLSGQPVRIGGRSAQITPGGLYQEPGTCMVELAQRSYTEASGNPRDNQRRVETLGVVVILGARQPTDAACRSATALARATAPRLPAAA